MNGLTDPPATARRGDTPRPRSTIIVVTSSAVEPDEAPPAPVALTEPREGTPAVVTTVDALADAVAAFAAGSGPVAVDAERASGYRYSQRAYLVQLRRGGAGTVLIDPIALPDLSTLGAALAGAEWVLHAASQDLACLAEIGLIPERIFDTELAGRLLGYERVGLGRMVEEVLGFTLEKGHSAADWSTRPLPEPWLRYAALDVELLVELRDVLAAELVQTGKAEWAEQEFAAVLAAPPPPPRAEPWRRLSGIHRLRDRRQLAAARALWEARDGMAQRRDVAPGRVLPDTALLAAVAADPRDAVALTALPVFGGPRMRRTAQTWLDALRVARALPAAELPSPTAHLDGPPVAARWAERDPAAAARLARLRAALVTLAAEEAMPVENLLEPALGRRLAWSPPEPLTTSAVAETLRAGGARPWQVALAASPLTAALAAPPPAAALAIAPLSIATAPAPAPPDDSEG